MSTFPCHTGAGLYEKDIPLSQIMEDSFHSELWLAVGLLIVLRSQRKGRRMKNLAGMCGVTI